MRTSYSRTSLFSILFYLRHSRAGTPGVKREHDGQPAPGDRGDANDGAAGGRRAQATAGDAVEGDGAGSGGAKRARAQEPGEAGLDGDRTDPGLTAAASARPPGVGYSDQCTVFVKGLGYDVVEEDLRNLFAGLGVKGVRLGRDRFTGASRVRVLPERPLCAA